MKTQHTFDKRFFHSMKAVGGFTLVELMVAMLLGLIVIGGVTSVFLAGQQTYRSNEALSDVESGSRVGFEMLARDIRDAGLTGCDSTNGRIANVVNPPFPWYADWNNALHGYDDASTDPALTGIASGSAGAPVAGQSSVHVLSTASTDVTVSSVPSANAANFQINAPTTQLHTGDLIMLCDFDHSTIMQIDNYSGNTVVIHNTGNKIAPGNCSKGLGYPTICTTNGNAYTFPQNSRVARLTAVVWYIGTNPVGGRSLYRLDASNSGTGTTAVPQEMVRGVTGMTISYLQPPNTALGNAASISNWAVVDAARIQLTLASANNHASVNGTAPITRTFAATVTVRNRVQ